MIKSKLNASLAVGLLLLAILGCRSITQPKPSWTKAKVLSDNEDHPSKIITDGQSVFYVTGGTVASQHEGTNNIKRISLKDGSVSVIVKGGDLIPDSTLAVDEKFLYWSDGANIMRVAKDGAGEGGESEKIIARAPKPDEMVLDDENIYWLIWGGEGSPPQPVMFAPKKGGEAKKLTPAYAGTSGISIDHDFVYWMMGDGIKKIPKTGGEISEVYHNSLRSPSLGLMQDADNFYFMQMNSNGESALMKLGKKSGELTQLAPSINHTLDFIIDEANVYYFAFVPNTGSFGPDALRKVPKGGGESIELDQGNSAWAKYLAVDSKQIYFTDISKVYALAK
jgi:sugar lactone lactonase YvrE